MSKLFQHFNKLNNWLNTKGSKFFVLILIISINAFFYLSSEYIKFPELQKRKDATGFSHASANRFNYFYYYKNLFPLATLEFDLDYSLEGANRQISEHGESLIMEYKHWSRLGESARILAYFPNNFIKGSPKVPSVKLFNAIFFVSGLIFVFLGFHRIGLSMIGFFLVIFINLTPFYLYEVYSNENIFALLASIFLIVLGINLPILFSKKVSYLKLIMLIIISGLGIAFCSEIRNEISIVICSLLAIYILSKSIKLIPKMICLILIVSTFFLGKFIIRNYFDMKYQETTQIVKKNGGHVYTGGRIRGHGFWHPVFCGLGDFDDKYGYQWNDKVAYNYAVPILKDKYNINISYSGKKHTDEYYDAAHLYYKKFDEIPEYENVIKNKVIADIKSDPIWYVSILSQRIIKILTTTLPIPFFGWLIFPLLFYLFKNKNWNFIKLIIVCLPLSVSPFIIYSASGATYNSIYPYFVISMALFLIFDLKKKAMN